MCIFLHIEGLQPHMGRPSRATLRTPKGGVDTGGDGGRAIYIYIYRRKSHEVPLGLGAICRITVRLPLFACSKSTGKSRKTEMLLTS